MSLFFLIDNCCQSAIFICLFGFIKEKNRLYILFLECQVCYVLEACVEELQRGRKRLEKPELNQDGDAFVVCIHAVSTELMFTLAIISLYISY